MMLAQFGLVLVYLCALLIKTCNESSVLCATFGFGDSTGVSTRFDSGRLRCTPALALLHAASTALRALSSNAVLDGTFCTFSLLLCAGIYLFFLFFGLALLLMQLVVMLMRLWIEGASNPSGKDCTRATTPACLSHAPSAQVMHPRFCWWLGRIR